MSQEVPQALNPALANRLGKYELTAILAARAQQLANNAPTTLDKLPTGATTAIEITLEEFAQNRLPLKLKRKYTNNVVKEFDLDTFVVYK